MFKGHHRADYNFALYHHRTNFEMVKGRGALIMRKWLDGICSALALFIEWHMCMKAELALFDIWPSFVFVM